MIKLLFLNEPKNISKLPFAEGKTQLDVNKKPVLRFCNTFAKDYKTHLTDEQTYYNY